MRIIFSITAIVLATTLAALAAEPMIATLRTAPLGETATPPRMTPQSNTDERQVRNYPEQPPVIPHKIEGYQVDLRVNKMHDLSQSYRRRRQSGAHGLDYPLHESGWTVSGVGLAATVLL